MRTRSLAILGLLCVTLAGCGGSSTAIPARSQSRTEATATATFAIKIPSKERSASVRRRPLYVSVNTNSIGITLNGKTTVVRLSSGQANCTTDAQTGTLDCTVGIEAVPVGNATFTLATYASVDGSGPALSSATISAKIVAGKANVIAVVLNGIPAMASFSPDGVEPFIEESDDPPSPPSLTIVGAAPQKIIVNLLDASGATIVGAGTPPSITIAPTDDCSTAAVQPQAVSGQPGVFTVAVTTPFASCDYQVMANGTPVPVSNNMTIGAIVAIYVVASSEIVIYDANGNIITPAGNFPGTPPAQKIAYNPSVPGLSYGSISNGPGLYVAGVDNSGVGLSTIRTYDLNGLPQTTLEPFSGVPVPEYRSQAVSIAFDDELSGLLYGVAATSTAANGSKQFTEFHAGGGNDLSPASNPLASASAALCAANCEVTAIAAPPAVVTPARTPPTLYLAYGPEFSEQTGEVIPFDIKSQAAGASFGTSMIGIPSSIAYCNGLVYVAYAGTNVAPTIRSYSAAAPSTSPTPAASAFSGILQPGAIACDADGSGDLYVADTDATLSKFDPLGNPLPLKGANNVTLAAPTDMVVVP